MLSVSNSHNLSSFDVHALLKSALQYSNHGKRSPCKPHPCENRRTGEDGFVAPAERRKLCGARGRTFAGPIEEARRRPWILRPRQDGEAFRERCIWTGKGAGIAAGKDAVRMARHKSYGQAIGYIEFAFQGGNYATRI